MSAPDATCVIVNKGERGVEATLDAVHSQAEDAGRPLEILVVDASGGALDDIYARYERVRVERFVPPPGLQVSIPHQRNVGVAQATANTIIFTDAGCVPEPGWLDALLAPLEAGEELVTGRTVARGNTINHYEGLVRAHHGRYVDECPTINLAFHRSVAEAVGGFDESFNYGSDVDFSWRVIAAGYRIRFAEDAVVRSDWGSWRRQLRRSYLYGKARARLYRKHRERRKGIFRQDPVVVVYPLFILGLPLALRWPAYLALLAVPAWRNRRIGGPAAVVDHLVYGLGVLAEVRSWSISRSTKRTGSGKA